MVIGTKVVLRAGEVALYLHVSEDDFQRMKTLHGKKLRLTPVESDGTHRGEILPQSNTRGISPRYTGGFRVYQFNYSQHPWLRSAVPNTVYASMLIDGNRFSLIDSVPQDITQPTQQETTVQVKVSFKGQEVKFEVPTEEAFTSTLLWASKGYLKGE